MVRPRPRSRRASTAAEEGDHRQRGRDDNGGTAFEEGTAENLMKAHAEEQCTRQLDGGTMLPMARRFLFAAMTALLLGELVGPRMARADEQDEPRSGQAQALFDRARELMNAGDLAQACALFAESQRLDPGGGTLLNLAVCHEKQGRLATAWSEYHDAESAAVRDDRKDRQAFAAQRIAEVEGRLPHVVVILPPDVPSGIIVKLDGAALSKFAIGAPLPVDPGPHDVIATAPGYYASSPQNFSASEGKLAEVRVPALARLLPIGVGPPHISTVSWVAGGVAIAGYATMAVTGALALSAKSTADSECDVAREYCQPGEQSEASRARALAWASTISMGVALAATVVAVVWPRKRGSERPPGVAVLADGSGLGLAF
jgi:hypothetical protein